MGLNRRSGNTGAGPRARKAPVDVPGAQADPVFRACADDCALRSETDHRIANHLAILSAYVRMKGADLAKGGPAGDSPLRLFTQSISAQIGSVARLHRLLITQDASAPVDLPTFLHEVCAPFAVGLDLRLVLVEDLGPDCAVRADQVLPIGQLVGEAIVNAAKHACLDSRGAACLWCDAGAGRRAGSISRWSTPARACPRPSTLTGTGVSGFASCAASAGSWGRLSTSGRTGRGSVSA
jgi:hypothetical protein